jgi:hypothetical protein
MARKGAEHRYQELKTEIGRLVKHFPHLRVSARAAGGASSSNARTGNSNEESGPVKRRKMSAKARRAISRAQKARWAKRKAAMK